MSTSDGSILGTTQIFGNAPRDRAFNVVLLADGFIGIEQSNFNGACARFVTALTATPPFDQLGAAINVFRVNVSSTDSGADDPIGDGGTGATASTYFDSSFGGNGIRRLLLCNNTTALVVAAAQVRGFTIVVVVVNSPIYGGAGGSVGTFSLADGASEIAIHEMGHSTAFMLADEYAVLAGGAETGHDQHPAKEPAAPNVTINTNRATLKWGWAVAASTALPTMSNPDCAKVDDRARTVPVGTVGLFEGADYFHCGAYRPEYSCKMQALGLPFCRVCRQVIWDRISPLMPARIAVVRANGEALVKEGGVSQGGPPSTPTSSRWHCPAIASRSSGRTARRSSKRAISRQAGSPCTRTSPRWRCLAIASRSCRTNGEALVKEGGLSAGWITEHTDVTQVALSGNRIAVLRANGEALVKEGGLSAGWITEHTDVIQVALSGNRIAVLRKNGEALVKEGGLSAGWITVHTDVTQVALFGNRVAVLRANGEALVKEGDLSAGWIAEHTDVIHVALSGNRIAILRTNGEALVKAGGLSAGWILGAHRGQTGGVERRSDASR